MAKKVEKKEAGIYNKYIYPTIVCTAADICDSRQAGNGG